MEGAGNRISFLNDTGSNSRTIEILRAHPRSKFLNTNDMMGNGADAQEARAQLRQFLVRDLNLSVMALLLISGPARRIRNRKKSVRAMIWRRYDTRALSRVIDTRN